MFKYTAKITNIVDGDTFDAEVDLGFNVFTKIRFRLNGIDTPEIRSSNIVERELALKSKDFLKSMILNKTLLIESYKDDKYGRWLASINIDGVDLSQRMISEGYGIAYFGGKKIT